MGTFKEFQESGILWALNRYVFHPRGFGLAFTVDDKTEEVDGWFLIGDGTEVWSFDSETDDSGFERFSNLLKERTNV